MTVQVLRHLGVFLLTALLASVAVFWLASVLPGDPARVALGVQASAADVARERAAMGLDRPAVVQYLDWLGGLLRGDLGTSVVSRVPVGPELGDRVQVTALLVLAAMLVAAAVAIPLGTLAALRHRHLDGAVLSGLSQVGVAVPSFLAGMVLVTVFAVRLGWFPAGGWVAPADGLGEFARRIVLPAVALGGVQGAILSRYVRAAVLDVLREDYWRTARSVGLTPLRALVRHGARNAAIPVLAVTGVQLAGLLVGAVVVERVFVVPGLGSYLLDKVGERDMVAVQGAVIVLVLTVLVITLVVDLLTTLVDPRLRRTT